MTPSSGRLVLISAVILLGSAATPTSGFNITLLLARYPGFELFNQLLSKSQLAENINRRRSITVLGLPNDRMQSIMQMTDEVQTSIMSLHIVLDYYDMMKLTKLKPNSKTELTTLYQSTGVADNKEGFILVTHRRDGTIVFGSAVSGAQQLSMLVSPVSALPFNLSVLSISQPIIAPGMDGSWVLPTEPTTPPPPPAPAPKKMAPPPAASPIEEDVVADEPTPAPTPAAAAPPPAPASAPAPADEEDAPAEEEDAPADEAENEEATPEKNKNGNVKQVVSGFSVWLVIGLASFLAAGH